MFQSGETIKDLEIPEGRRLLHDFFHDRRARNLLEFRTIMDCWRLCRKGRVIHFSDGRHVRLETSLGFRLGTRVFFEEIVGRYYYNLVAGIVYGGAVLLLAALGFYLAGYTSKTLVLAAFALEAVFLLLLALITAYSPNEQGGESGMLEAIESLFTSMNNTVREMTNVVSDLFRLISQSDIRQDVLLTRLTEHITKIQSESTHRYTEKLEETNGLLRLFLETSYKNQVELTRQYTASLQETREVVEKLASALRRTAVPQTADGGMEPPR
ncbi:MAG: hypothetical protein QHI48_11930 [Bacteroidota bacterium]|nr:hypothetical protein [Bacteroidota bacterium]